MRQLMSSNSLSATLFHLLLFNIGMTKRSTSSTALDIGTWHFILITLGTIAGGSGVNGFDNSLAPNVVVESYDGTSADFLSLDVHGYFNSVGSILGTYLYPACWGTTAGGKTCPGGNSYCAMPQSWNTEPIWVGGTSESPSDVQVIGHVVSGGAYGATYEWGIGSYRNGYNAITDEAIPGNTNLCNTQIS